jgi:hypothetical protein
MKKIFIGFCATMVLATVFGFTVVTNWKIADGYNIVFSTSGVSGVFKNLTGNRYRFVAGTWLQQRSELTFYI